MKLNIVVLSRCHKDIAANIYSVYFVIKISYYTFYLFEVINYFLISYFFCYLNQKPVHFFLSLAWWECLYRQLQSAIKDREIVIWISLRPQNAHLAIPVKSRDWHYSGFMESAAKWALDLSLNCSFVMQGRQKQLFFSEKLFPFFFIFK